MRRILIFILITSSYPVYSQSDSVSVVVIQKQIDDIQLHLKEAHDNHLIGSLFTVAGASAVFVSQLNSIDADTSNSLIIAGISSMALGVIVNEIAWFKIGAAGKKKKKPQTRW